MTRAKSTKPVGRTNTYNEDIKTRLDEVTEWAKLGLSNNQIAHNLGIGVSTFYDYQLKHIEFLEAVKKGKSEIDYQVQNALCKRALGYQYDEVTKELVYNDKLKKSTMESTRIVTKQIPPDVAAMIFWLKNRMPDDWKDKQEVININKDDNLTEEEIEKRLKELGYGDKEK